MKIALDITQVQYQGTGIGNYTAQLTDGLLKIDDKNKYLLFGTSIRQYQTLKKFAGKYKSAEQQIYPFPPTLTELIFNQYHHLPIENFIGNIDIFHASDWSHPKVEKAKMVTTIHDLSPIIFPEYQHPKTIAVYKRGLKLVQKEADAVITDSQASKADIVKHLNIDPDKIHVVYLGISPKFLDFAHQDKDTKQASASQVAAKFNLAQPYALCVGTREPRKNLNRVIKAFNRLIDNTHLNLDLVIAGRYGWGEEDGQISPNIKLVGPVSDMELLGLYYGSRVFIYPSLYEGFGLPVLEAMSLGVPVVTSNKGSLKEVAGDAAVVVDPENIDSISQGILTAVKTPDQYTKLGLIQAGKFSWEKTAKQTLAVYEHVAKHTHLI
jgi:glycosyltransferase involved in cell wall biosynthesis